MAAVPRAVADTALEMRGLRDVRALVTDAVQRGLAAPADLVAELEAGPQQGSALLRHAVADLVDGARSVAEAEAIELLRRRRVPPFEVNVPLVDERGVVVAVADILWRELRAVLEIDSREFHFGERRWKATMRRHNLLLRLGYATAHYPPSEIRSRGAAWADEVAGWLAARAREIA